MEWIKGKIVPADIPNTYSEFQGASATPVSGGELKAQAFRAGGLWHFQIMHEGSDDGITSPRYPRLEELFSAMKILLPDGLAMGGIFNSGGVDGVVEGEPAGLMLTEYGKFDRKPVM